MTPSLIQQALQTAGSDLRGPVWLRLTTVLSIALVTWIATPSNLVVQGLTSGATGSGVTSGRLIVRPIPLVLSQVSTAKGLLGVNTLLLDRAIGVGVANAFTTGATYRGISLGVGVGSDVVTRVIPNPSTLTTILMASGLTGAVFPQLASSLAQGISNLLATQTQGAGIVSGVAGPSPASGTSISQVR